MIFNEKNNIAKFSTEERAELIILSLLDFLEKLFEKDEGYSEEKEFFAEKIIIKSLNFLGNMLDEDQQHIESKIAS